MNKYPAYGLPSEPAFCAMEAFPPFANKNANPKRSSRDRVKIIIGTSGEQLLLLFMFYYNTVHPFLFASKYKYHAFCRETSS